MRKDADHVEGIGCCSWMRGGGVVFAGVRVWVGMQPVGFGERELRGELFAFEFVVGRVWRLFALGIKFVHLAERGELLGQPLGFGK